MPMQTDFKLTKGLHTLSFYLWVLCGLMLLCSVTLSVGHASSPHTDLLSVNSYPDHLDHLGHLDSALKYDQDRPKSKPKRTYEAVTKVTTPPSTTLAGIRTQLRNDPELAHDQQEFFANYYGQPPNRGRWLLIDTDLQTLTVLQDNQPVRVYENIATGRGGLAYFKIQNDEKTVLGTFYINLINPSSQYHAFFRFAYPTHAHFDYALEKKLITPTDYAAALAYYRQYGAFPQDTVLGGHLGIHGLGEADYDTHLMFNWTRGCVALSNEQIDSLRREIAFGTVVVIK